MRKELLRGGGGGGSTQEAADRRLPDSVGPGALYALPVESSVDRCCDLLVAGASSVTTSTTGGGGGEVDGAAWGGAGEERELTLSQIFSRSPCCWRPVCAALMGWPDSASTVRSSLPVLVLAASSRQPRSTQGRCHHSNLFQNLDTYS